LAVARKRMFRIVGELLHPIAQLRHMHAQVLRSLHIGHASLLDQPHSLKLELAGKLPSLHDPPPAPSKHLTRCLRNRVQARPSNVRDSRVHNYPPRWNAAPSQELLEPILKLPTAVDRITMSNDSAQGRAVGAH